MYFNIADGLEPVITLEGFVPQIATEGTATFTNVPETPAPGIPFTIELEGYETISDNVIVDGDELVNINLTLTNISEYQNSQILIYPNPSSGIFNVRTFEKLSSIIITDITGKTILTIEYVPFHIDLSNHPKGMYFIQVETESSIYTQKLIIQ